MDGALGFRTLAEPTPALGLGEEYRLAGPGAASVALVARERVPHVVTFLTLKVNQ